MMLSADEPEPYACDGGGHVEVPLLEALAGPSLCLECVEAEPDLAGVDPSAIEMLKTLTRIAAKLTERSDSFRPRRVVFRAQAVTVPACQPRTNHYVVAFRAVPTERSSTNFRARLSYGNFQLGTLDWTTRVRVQRSSQQ
jgi:hypothetical protein